MQETRVRPLGWEDPLEREWLSHSNILAWRFPWTEESGGLWSIGSQRVGHDWATKHSTVRVQSADWYILRSQQISKKIIPSFTDETLKASETWSRFLGGWQSWTSIQIFWCHVWSHPMVTWKSKIRKRRDFLVVWWLRCCTSNAGGMSLIPGQGTKSPHIAQCGKNIYRGKRKKEKWKIWCLSERIHLQYSRRGLIPGLGISPREGNGNPLQYSCLETPMDRGAWQSTVHAVAELNRTEQLHFHFHSQRCLAIQAGSLLGSTRKVAAALASVPSLGHVDKAVLAGARATRSPGGTWQSSCSDPVCTPGAGLRTADRSSNFHDSTELARQESITK